MGGYRNNILRVNLSNQTFSNEELSDELIHNYIGGRGFGIKMLYDELKPGTDPLGPDAKLILLTGPMAGTDAQSFARWKAVFKSPLTGGYFKSSGGGRLAAEMKFAGLDAIIIEGRSEKPIYLWIHDDACEFRDATYLNGLSCGDTHTLIREELRDPFIRIACIGPAGENLVKYAGIFSDRRTAGRGGGGAVMGAKHLKAVAIRGAGAVPVANPDALREAIKSQIKIYRDNSYTETFSARGTQNPEITLTRGMFPTRNFREGILPHWDRIEGANYKPMRFRNTACYHCILHCGKMTKVHTGKYAGHWSEGPEYETIWGFTGPIGCSDIGLTVAADQVCDELGLDTLSVAGSIGFAFELYEKGYITQLDTDGLELVYGNDDVILPLLRKIALREGFGDFLAEGTREMSRRIGKGSDYFAIHVKGLELPAYDPRGAKAQGLNLMTQNIGADHNSGPGAQEFLGTHFQGKPVNRFEWQGKGAMTKYNQDLIAAQDCGIMCVFAGSLFFRDNMEPYGRLLREATGINDFADSDYLWKVGERIYNLERMFNIREGFRREDDILPRRLLEEAIPAGPSAGQKFEAEPMLDEYYRARGWDETGVPSEAKLKELGLDFTLE